MDGQSDLLDELDTRVVIRLRPVEQVAMVKLPELLTPVFEIEGDDYILETPKMAAVPRRILKRPVTSMAVQQKRITAAQDFLFQGF